MLRHEPHLAAGRAARIDDEMRLDRAGEARDRPGHELGRLVRPDHGDEQAAGAEAGEIARHVAGAADHLFLAPHRDHRHRRLRRHPRHLAIDEVIEHEVADAQHGAMRELLQRGLVVEHQRCTAFSCNYFNSLCTTEVRGAKRVAVRAIGLWRG